MKKYSVAIYSLYGRHEHVIECSELHENDTDYTRLTEPTEVEFTDLPKEVIQEGLIAEVQGAIDHEGRNHLRRMATLNEKMAKLRALPAPENYDVEVTLGPGYDGEEDVVIHD